MAVSLRQKWTELVFLLQSYQKVLVAFSGGCDSMFLLAAACRTLHNENVLAVTAFSDSLPTAEKNDSRQLAQELNANYRCIQTSELSNPAYAANPYNRCFFCKDELFHHLAPLAEERRMVLIDGFNASDRSDYRPGLQAAEKWDVRHPLDKVNLTKRDIRILSRWLGLRTWNKPASPCLSSRIPYGTPVTVHTLRQIELAETLLHDEGFEVVRVRHFGTQARIEVELSQIPRLLEPERWQRIATHLHALGYPEVSADPRGFKSGRLNEENKLSYAPFARAYEKKLKTDENLLTGEINNL